MHTFGRCLVLLVLVVLASAAPAARAHELGAFQVYATFLQDGTYLIEVPVEEDHLPPGQGGFEKVLRALADGAAIAFDGQKVEPRVEVAPPDPAAPGVAKGTLRLSGAIPGGARAFTWANAHDLGPYPLVLKNEGDESAVWQWLEAGATSPPFSLSAEVVPPAR